MIGSVVVEETATRPQIAAPLRPRLAYITLVKEDKAKITAEAIQERVALLEWLFSVIGLPLEPAVIVPLEDVHVGSLPCALCRRPCHLPV